jgi:lysozyme
MEHLTPRIIAEIANHEAIILEAYLDSVKQWTWGVGITNNSGHRVYPRYLDKPQTIGQCMEVYKWVLKKNYLPAVLHAFRDRELTENELGGALSFHWNTGAIGHASWVKDFMAGHTGQAEIEIMNWVHPHSLHQRREEERDLFFHDKWSDGFANVYPVHRASHHPDFRHGKRVNVIQMIEEHLAKENDDG